MKLIVEVMMESTDKLTDTKAILAYLCEAFPLCFIAEGEVKPLKIGLFQDLAERLSDDSKVSKTQLRVALRRYTSSWRYLKSIKEGAQRVDLDGNSCGELDAEHIAHAQKQLKESQERAKARRVEQNKSQPSTKPASEKRVFPKKTNKHKSFDKPKDQVKNANRFPNTKTELSLAELDKLKLNQNVSVKLGKKPTKGVIVEISKEDVHVQLESGLTVKVRASHILV